MVTAFSWLHLSDVHGRHGDGDYREDQRWVLRDVVESAGKPPDGLERVDAIFLTGDIGTTGGVRDPGEYRQVAELVAQCAAALRVDPSRIFIVAGNHDVDRGVATRDPDLKAALTALRDGTMLASERPASATPGFAERVAGWRRFVAEAAPPLAARLDADGAWWVDVDGGGGGLPLRIVGLNTALLSQ